MISWSQGGRRDSSHAAKYRPTSAGFSHTPLYIRSWPRGLTYFSSKTIFVPHVWQERRFRGGNGRKYHLTRLWARAQHQSRFCQSHSSTTSDPGTRAQDDEQGNVGQPQKCTESEKDQSGLKTASSARHKKKRFRASGPTPTDLLVDILQNPHLEAQKQKSTPGKVPRLSLQTIVNAYLRFIEPILAQTGVHDFRQSKQASTGLDKALSHVFCERHLKYLEDRRYSVADVVSWVWILKSKTAYESILRIFILEGNRKNKHGTAVNNMPTFIPMLLLRNPSFDAKTFRLILIYSIHLMTGRPLPSLHFSTKSMLKDVELGMKQPFLGGKVPLDPSTCMLSVVRLLRHARQVWPQAQLTIARAFAYFMIHTTTEEKHSKESIERMNRFRAEKFNACLWQLSLPPKPGPFTSVSIQQQAQFELLKAMANHQPVLPVSRRGYQGVIAVQLAHKKTPAERQSAALKAPSWPPWKEERIGIDSHRGIEGMKSRAMQVMAQMIEAGYSHTRSEEVSAIYAGWDTDRSPTIQTRKLRAQSLSRTLGSQSDHQAIWVARIRATRTVREAWACFLSYQDRDLPPRLSIYAAMAEKLIFRRKAVEGKFEEVSGALPGDGPEVFSEPSSARDLIYVRTEPPTPAELLNQMHAQGIQQSGKFLSLLLRTAVSFNSGLEYLSSSDLPKHQIQALCTVRDQQSDYDTKEEEAIAEVPENIFSSFIGFLCKFSSFDATYLAQNGVRTAHLFPIAMGQNRATEHSTSSLLAYAERSETDGDFHHPMTLHHAIQLVKLRNSNHPWPWNQLLSALARDRFKAPYRNLSRGSQRIMAWSEMLEVTKWMEERQVELGMQGFQVLCASFSRAVIVKVRYPSAAAEAFTFLNESRRVGNLPYLDSIYRGSSDLIPAGLHFLKGHFERLILPDPQASYKVEGTVHSAENYSDPQVAVPSMLQVPSPAVLHAYVRALGLAEDYDGLLNLLRWMSASAVTLKEASDEYLNGERMMRRTLTAARVFIEGPPWGKESLESNDSEEQAFSNPMVKEAYDIVAATPFWGSWPSDDDVWEYVNRE